MPLINRYKICNFKYGTSVDRLLENRTIDLLGGHLQIEASNSIGKSMSIQTLIQAICPLSNVAKKFTEVYTRKEPVCVLIEWILDDEKTRILTGVAFERKTGVLMEDVNKLGKNALYKLVQFVIELDGQIPVNIDNFPTETIDSNNHKTICSVSKVEEYVKNLQSKYGKSKVSCYGIHSRSEYKKRLQQYGISQDEWKDIIIELNKDNKEGGLSELIKSYKTSEALLKNKLVPLIEKTLTTMTDSGPQPSILVLKEQVQACLENAIVMKDKLEDYENLLVIQQLVGDIQNELDDVLKMERSILETQDLLANLYACIENKKNSLEEENEVFSRERQSKLNEKEQIKYESDSYDYHQEEEKLNVLKTEQVKVEQTLKQQERALNEAVKKLNILAYQSKLQSIQRENYAKTKKEAEKEKCSKEYEEIIEMLRVTGSTLHQLLLDLGQSLKVSLTETEELLLSKRDVMDTNKASLNQVITQLAELQAKKKTHLQLEAKYEQRVNDFVKNTPDSEVFVSENLFGKVIDFGNYKKALMDKITTTEKEESSLKKNIEELDLKISNLNNQIEQLKEDRSSLRNKIVNLKDRYQLAVSIEESFNKLKERYSIHEQLHQQQSLIHSLEDKTNQLRIEESRLTDKKRELEKKVTDLENLKTIHLDDEFIRELASMDIHVVEGSKYLSQLEGDLDYKASLVERNPLLPYSIVVTESEFNKLKNKGVLSKITSVIPVFLRNHLDVPNAQVATGIYDYNGLTLVTSFDIDMLDAEVRRAKIERLKSVINDVREHIAEISLEIKNISHFSARYQAFGYTEADANLSGTITVTESELNTIEVSIQRFEQQIDAFKGEISKTNELIEELKNERLMTYKSVDNLSRLEEVYQEVIASRNELELQKNEKYRLNQNKQSIENQIGTLEKELDSLKLQKIELTKKIEFNELEVAKYKSYQAEILVENQTIEELKATFEAYSKNSNTSQLHDLTKEIQDIENRLLEYQKELNDIKEQIDDSVAAIEATTVVETESELKEVKNKLTKEVVKLQKDFNSLDKKIEAKLALNQRLKEEIAKNYNGNGVYPLEMITNFNFKNRLEQNKSELKDIDDIIEENGKTISKLSEELRFLNKYKVEGKAIIAVPNDLFEESKKLQQELEVSIKEKSLKVKDYERAIAKLKNFDLSNSNKYSKYVNGVEIHIDSYEKQNGQLDTVLMVLKDELAKIEHHTVAINAKKDAISKLIKDYLLDLINEFKRINKFGKHKGVELFYIPLPKPEEIETNLSKVDVLINDIINDADLKDIDDKITAFYLLNYTMGLGSAPIKVVKYELGQGKGRVETIKWNDIESKTSGAQRFCIAFIVTVVLLEYRRYNRNYEIDDNKSKGKTLLMDNPFGETSEQKFLDEIFDLANKFNVQIISYTHVKNDSIRSHFNKIYSLSLSETPSNKELVSIHEIKQERDGSKEEFANFGLFGINESEEYTTQANLFELID